MKPELPSLGRWLSPRTDDTFSPTTAAPRWTRWLPPNRLPVWQALLIGLALGAVGSVIRLLLPSAIGGDALFVTFVPFVALAAALGGAPAGLASVVVATAIPSYGRSVGFWPLADFWLASILLIGLITAYGAAIRDLRSNRAHLANAKAQLETIARELAHRGRNSLFIIMSIVSQSAKGASTPAEAAQVINSRLEAMLRAQDLLVRSERGAIGLKGLLDTALSPFGFERFEVTASPDISLAVDVGVSLGLVFHELATNAVKYGALAAPSGRVAIGWTLSGDRALLCWREFGGPAVSAPTRRGFGSKLLDVALVPQGGRAERRFEVSGLVCELTIPAPPNPPQFLSPVPAGTAFPGPAARGGYVTP